jgi:S1-C subfamily serine protease
MAHAANTFQKQAIEPVVQLARNCSGVVLDTSGTVTYIVTANHCVEGEQSGYVNIDVKAEFTQPVSKKSRKGALIETKQLVYDVIRRDSTNDLAVLRLRKEGLELDGAVIAQEDPTEGDQVWAIGYPLGLTRTVTEGYYGGFMSLAPDMSFDDFGNGRDVYRATPPIYGGNSGGGLFIKDGDEYKLVGISDAAVMSFFVAGFYNPQKEVNAIVNEALKSETKSDGPTVTARSEKE